MTNFSLSALLNERHATAFGHLTDCPIASRNRARAARKAQAKAQADAAAVADWNNRFWALRSEAIRVGGSI